MGNQIGQLLVGVGAMIMALSLLRFRSVLGALPFVSRDTRNWVRHLIQMHGALIVIFLAAYVVTALAFADGWPIVGELFIGAVFIFGALFVYLGLSIQSRLVGELLQTVGNLIPICAECRKVRLPDTDPARMDSWQPVDLVFRGASESLFSHGICPDCAAKLASEKVPAATGYNPG